MTSWRTTMKSAATTKKIADCNTANFIGSRRISQITRKLTAANGTADSLDSSASAKNPSAPAAAFQALNVERSTRNEARTNTVAIRSSRLLAQQTTSVTTG